MENVTISDFSNEEENKNTWVKSFQRCSNFEIAFIHPNALFCFIYSQPVV